MAGISAGNDDCGYADIRIQPFSSTPSSKERQCYEGKDSLTYSQLLRERLGLEEFCCLEAWRASFAELLGSAVLVFALDTIVISSVQTQTKTPNLIMAAVIAITITVLLLATAPVSGGHLNPTITLSAALIGLVSPGRATIYILTQFAGAILGALSLKAIVGGAIEHAFSLGGCTLTIVTSGPEGPITVGLKLGPALWLEIICTFIFLFASIWIAFDHRQAKALGPVVVCSIIGVVVGLMVFISTTVTAQKGYAGAGMNPARCFGPALVRGGHLWDGHWVFWVGPIVACFAFYFYTIIIPPQHFHAHHGYKYDFFTTLKVVLGFRGAKN